MESDSAYQSAIDAFQTNQQHISKSSISNAKHDIEASEREQSKQKGGVINLLRDNELDHRA